MIDYLVKGKTVTSKYYTKLLKKVDVKVVKTDPETEFLFPWTTHNSVLATRK